MGLTARGKYDKLFTCESPQRRRGPTPKTGSGGPRFLIRATVAQLVEQLIRNQQVAGSSPASSSKNWSKSTDFDQFLLFQVFVLHQDDFNPHRTRWISVRLCQLFQVKGLLTNTPKVPQKEGKHQRKDCVFSLVLLSLHRGIPAWWMQLSHPPRYSPRLKGHGCERMP